MPGGDRRGLSEGIALRLSAKIAQRSGSRALILLLLLPVALALVFRDFFRESLVVPLLYVLWLGYEYVKSLPQGVLWALFLFFGFVWILRSGLGVSTRRRRSKPEEEEPLGRVEAWRERVRLARRSRGGYGERYFANHLAKLALQILADRRRIEPRQLRREFLWGSPDLDIPDEALRVVRMGVFRPPEQSSRGGNGEEARRPFDPEPLLQVLEEELRVARSDSGRNKTG